MNNKEQLKKNGFPDRFKRFMEEVDPENKLNPNSLAAAMCESKDPEEIKALGVKYRRWSKGDVSPAYEGLVDIAVKYSIDMNWFMLGKGSMLMVEPKKTKPNVVSVERRMATDGELQVVADLYGIIDAKGQEIEDLRGELHQSKSTVLKLKDELLKQVLPGLDFLRSGSRPTAVDLMTRAKRVDGLIRYDEEEVECKVLPLNNANSLLNQAHGVLNSLAPFEVYKKVV